MTTNILLADDHKILLEGLRGLLEEQPDMAVVAEAKDGREAVEQAAKVKPDVVIMDVTMPGLNGIDATRKILADQPNTNVIGLSMHADRRFVEEMLRAGAKGYVLKDGAFEELSGAVRAVVSGKTYLSPRVTGAVVEGYLGRQEGKTSAFARLTNREREVLQLMAEGRSTKQIAMDLKVSVKTVETHRRQLMEKLDIHSVAELTKYAIREGLTTAGA